MKIKYFSSTQRGFFFIYTLENKLGYVRYPRLMHTDLDFPMGSRFQYERTFEVNGSRWLVIDDRFVQYLDDIKTTSFVFSPTELLRHE